MSIDGRVEFFFLVVILSNICRGKMFLRKISWYETGQGLPFCPVSSLRENSRHLSRGFPPVRGEFLSTEWEFMPNLTGTWVEFPPARTSDVLTHTKTRSCQSVFLSSCQECVQCTTCLSDTSLHFVFSRRNQPIKMLNHGRAESPIFQLSSGQCGFVAQWFLQF